MDYLSFVESLKILMPDIEILKNLNYSEKEISKLKNSYVLNKKLSIDNFNQDLGEFGKLL